MFLSKDIILPQSLRAAEKNRKIHEKTVMQLSTRGTK
jgi:hypothetical protein